MILGTVAAIFGLLVTCGQAQSSTDAKVLQGLAPVTTLMNTNAGKSALAANLAVTGEIQRGTSAQPTLLPFPEQQQQALRDAFITDRNLAELTDGLGTTLGSAYVARFHYNDEQETSNLPKGLSDLILYAVAVSGRHAYAGKFLFANGTSDGKTAVSPEDATIIKSIKGVEDVFGKAYHVPADTPGADRYGDSRPFQTEPSITWFAGPDYFYHPSGNFVYNHGPAMDLTNSPSYPSGHTTYGYTGAVLLAVLLPERYPEMIARAAEYGNDRIIMGSHYAMDVLGGRTLALYDMAHLLANDPAYMGLSVKGVPPIGNFQATLKKARTELHAILQTGCGNSITICASEDTGRFSNPEANQAFYDSTQTYNLPVVYSKNATTREHVSQLAPEAGYLLTAAFPSLTLKQADRILTETEGPGGGFLDDGSSFGVYSRLNLYAAALRAQQMVANH
jgi:hypothetical protein